VDVLIAILCRDVVLKYLVFPTVMEAIVLAAMIVATRKRFFLALNYKHVGESGRRILIFIGVLVFSLVLEAISPLTLRMLMVPIELVYAVFVLVTLARSAYYFFVPFKLEVLADLVNTKSNKREALNWVRTWKKSSPFVKKYVEVVKEVREVHGFLSKQSFWSDSLLNALAFKLLLTTPLIFDVSEVTAILREECLALRLKVDSSKRAKPELLNIQSLEYKLVEAYEESIAIFEEDDRPEVECSVREYVVAKVFDTIRECEIDYLVFLLQALIKETSFTEKH